MSSFETKHPPIILASGSAIRRQILDQAGLNFDVVTRPVDEAAIKDTLLAQNVSMRNIAEALAEAKSMRVKWPSRLETYVKNITYCPNVF